MESRKLEIKAAIQISKTAREVFEGIVEPVHMTHYFISESTGRMEEGRELVWRFPEYDMNVPVRVGKVEQDRLVTFHWGDPGKETEVRIGLAPFGEGNKTTVVRVTEGTMDLGEEGINWLISNTEGWANFVACLKAYLEYGINLRRGAFDFRA
ncbi:SRPBCC domain-containing protein [Dyadobacter sp. 676]|uniref:SRPBCC domain-containing protein n=1 Tax=Dyadobacter sp. 676 TaxID=3088362 RepID=A0AAU8FNM0_9BACT